MGEKMNYKLLSILLIPLAASAETATYDTATNTFKVPFVRLNNATFTDVTMSCDPDNGYSCVLKGAESQICTSGTYGKYSIRTSLAQDGIQFGGIQVGGIDPDSAHNFTASWISSPKNKNPYLTNQDLSLFEDNQAYGVVGENNFESFFEGDLIHVTTDSNGYIVTKVSNGKSITFSKGQNFTSSNDCASTSDNYRGAHPGGDIDKLYSVKIVDTSTGSIQHYNNINSGDRFIVSWTGEAKIMERYNSAILTFKGSRFDLFLPTDKMFMTDIGKGISITTFDTESGKVKSTAVFMQMP